MIATLPSIARLVDHSTHKFFGQSFQVLSRNAARTHATLLHGGRPARASAGVCATACAVASKILFGPQRMPGYLGLGLALFLVVGRPRGGAPSDGSFSTEYSCFRVLRARNPRAPRHTLAGQ